MIITTESTDSKRIPENSLDYIFVDPPFGSNLMYSESSFAYESWLRVQKNNTQEAVVNNTQHKGEHDYTAIMRQCFGAMNWSLKPGRWITVEFHNSKNSIGTAIQESLTAAGFVVADQDIKPQSRIPKLVNFSQRRKTRTSISAYKPNSGSEERFKLTAGTEEGIIDFIRTHLNSFLFCLKNGQAEIIAERTNFCFSTEWWLSTSSAGDDSTFCG